MILTIALLAHLVIAPQDTRAAPPLRIVVLDGEDAVNVIQQKSAVAPVVEVRDRNNLPVAGATVTFTIGGNTASFAGGVQTITVATNAAGQAAAAALNPLASGAVQIQVAAAFQGQTAAATIVQTNVLTAAQAASAAGASSAGASGGSAGGTTTAAGGAAGGGGGVSGTTLGVIGAAVAGGALAATQAGGNEEVAETASSAPRDFRGTFTFDITLRFQGCTRVETWSGQLIIAVASTAPLNGNAAINNGAIRISAVTCTGGPQLGSGGTFFMGVTPLRGTASDIGFESEQSNPFPPGPNEVGGINTQGFKFTGALNGAEITGTLTHTRRIESNGSTVPGTGTASVAVTLR